MAERIATARWNELQPLVDLALDLAPGERPAFLKRACGDDEESRREIERMVSECEARGSGLTAPAFERFPELLCDDAPLSLQLPVTFAGYLDVERVLGRGGSATVYLARDLKHQRHVAVKVLRRSAAESLGARRFLDEIRTTTELQHPNVLPVFDSGEAHGRLFFVMPYVEGETLRAVLERRGRLPMAEVVRIAIAVGAALDCAHGQGVVHRDVKPENILLSRRDGHVYVSDFGIALALQRANGDRITQPGLVVGTPAYMSPEHGSGLLPVDGRADVYSLACVVQEMLTGVRPVLCNGKRGDAVERDARTASPALTDSLPLAVVECVVRGLARNPDERFASAPAFTGALADACGGRLPMFARRLLAPSRWTRG